LHTTVNNNLLQVSEVFIDDDYASRSTGSLIGGAINEEHNYSAAVVHGPYLPGGVIPAARDVDPGDPEFEDLQYSSGGKSTNDHNYSAAVVHRPYLPAEVIPAARDVDPGDPELEELQYSSGVKSTNVKKTPEAAWVLTTVFLLSVLQRIYHSENVISEIAANFAKVDVRKKKENQPYSRRIMIFCLTLAGYSWNAYNFLRSTVNNSLPCRRTLTKFRNKADGSPGIQF